MFVSTCFLKTVYSSSGKYIRLSIVPLREFETFAEQWRLGPYGFIWDGGKVKRKPTRQEFEVFKERRVLNESKAKDPKQ